MAIRVHRAFPSVRLAPPPQISWPALTMTDGTPCQKMIALWMVVRVSRTSTLLARRDPLNPL